MKVGVVSIVGRPNAGKSTLLNSIIKEKVSITSDKPQTTRNNIQGIYNDDESQIVFIDTPGVHKPVNKLGKFLNNETYSAFDTDVILFLVDSSKPFGKGDEFILDKIKEYDSKVFLILSKIDKVKKDELYNLINEYKDKYNFDEIIPVSAIKDNNVEELLNVIKSYLNEGTPFYANDLYTDQSVKFMVSEIIREKIFRKTDKEIPYSTTVIIENYDENKSRVVINACIVVERDAVKKIIVGKSGSMIKEIGINAREDIEKLVGKRVDLELFVKTVNNWRDKDKLLAELGFDKKDFE
ncbi:MAG: GTPase Era [Bacilli bacterium]|nr:GTPase Era [Bacilli bacterium]